MNDLEIRLQNRPGALAEMGEALATAGIGIEGGGGRVCGDDGVMHFLFQDGAAAQRALVSAAIDVVSVNDVVTVRLAQSVPGQLGKIARRMAVAGINVRVVYSDHDRRLIMVADPIEKARDVAERWMRDTEEVKA